MKKYFPQHISDRLELIATGSALSILTLVISYIFMVYGINDSYLLIQTDDVLNIQTSAQNKRIYEGLSRILKINNMQKQIKLEKVDGQIILSPLYIEESEFLNTSYYLAKGVIDSINRNCENFQAVTVYIYNGYY